MSSYETHIQESKEELKTAQHPSLVRIVREFVHKVVQIVVQGRVVHEVCRIPSSA